MLESMTSAYNQGSSTYTIAKQLGISQTAVWRTLKRNGIPRRSTSQAVRKFSVNECFFDSIDTEEKAYWLGFLLSDGGIYQNSPSYYGIQRKTRIYGRLECILQTRDQPHLEKLKEALGSNHPIKLKKIKFKNFKEHVGSRLAIVSKRLVEPLLRNGWIEFKKRGIVKILDDVRDDLKLHLVRGMIDADGHVGICARKNKFAPDNHYPMLWFYDLHKSVVAWVQNWVCRNFDIKPTKIYVQKYKGRISSYMMAQTSKSISGVVTSLYRDAKIFLDRKRETAERIWSTL